MNSHIIKNYFEAASSWIANLGVVPLFLFSAFLLAPAFTLLLDLTFFKIFVFDTIFKLLKQRFASNQFCSNLNYLLRFKHNVKIFLTAIIVSSHLTSINALASTVSTQNVIISTGEHKEIKSQNLHSFTIGNKDVLSHIHRKKAKKILIKGKKQGFSEVIVWDKTGKTVYKVYVLSKLKYLKFLHISDTFQNLNLKTTLAGPILIVEGTIDTISKYRLINKLYLENKKILQVKVKLSQKLKNTIIGIVYKTFFNQYIDSIQCDNESIDIFCRYPQSNTPSKSTLKELKERYFINFSSFPDQSKFRNFKIRMKLIQIEKINGEELNFGLDQINGTLGELFTNGLIDVIKKNKVSIGQQSLNLSTLAEPEMLIKLEEKGVVEVGSNIPFQIGDNNKQSLPSLNWKFAGLKIQILLKKEGKDIQLKYKTEFTKPESNHSSISGSKESGTALIPLNKPLQLFQIGFKTIGKGESRFPFLNKIPLLGRIFKSTSNKSTYKKISGVIFIEELDL